MKKANHMWRYPKISEDIKNISENVSSISRSQSQDVFHQTLCRQQYFSFKIGKIGGGVPSSTWTFLFLHWFDWVSIFFESVLVKAVIAQNSQLKAQICPLAWVAGDQSFHPAGVKFTLRAWELAGIQSPSLPHPSVVNNIHYRFTTVISQDIHGSTCGVSRQTNYQRLTSPLQNYTAIMQPLNSTFYDICCVVTTLYKLFAQCTVSIDSCIIRLQEHLTIFSQYVY